LKRPPTAEIGTQTDLTAEQISQMEKDLENYRDLLYQGAMEIDKLEKEITTSKTEINQLKEQVKDLGEPNETEKQLMEYEYRVKYPTGASNLKIIEEKLTTGNTPDKR
jgi:septal ring factor EnvC (AmiA/AmiB activator)